MTPELDFPLAQLRIRLEHGDSMAGPTGHSIELRGSGDVIYDGHERSRLPGRHVSRVPPEEVFKLFTYAVEFGFYEMDDHYHAPGEVYFDEDRGHVVAPGSELRTDMQSSTVTIWAGDHEKSVSNYDDPPPRLRRLQKRIEALARPK